TARAAVAITLVRVRTGSDDACAVVWVPRQPLCRGIFWRTFVSEGILAGPSDASSFSFVVALDKRVALSDVHSGLNQKNVLEGRLALLVPILSGDSRVVREVASSLRRLAAMGLPPASESGSGTAFPRVGNSRDWRVQGALRRCCWPCRKRDRPQ